MRAELISIGDEILIGQIVNTNATYMAKVLNAIGVEVVQITSISDAKEHIVQSLEAAFTRADIVLFTGGLGPTNDDITKHTLTDYFNDRLVWYPDILEHIEAIFKKYVATPIAETNRQQAILPEKARIFKNAFGTASGMWFDHNDKVVVSLPGVPYEMKSLMENGILKALQQRFEMPHILHKTLLTYGLGESVIAERIADWEAKLPPTIKLAYLPSLGRVRLRLSTKGKDLNELQSQMDEQIAAVLPLIEDIYFGLEEEHPIEVQIGQRLKESKYTLSCAESCTGGTIASRITAHAGASQFFKGSAVTYAPSAKAHFLGVTPEVIDEHGVVSAAVAKAMALGAQKEFKTDYAIGVTGNAGPTTEEGTAAVGAVFIAIATPNGVFVEYFMMGNHRERVIQKSVNKAFEMLYRALV